MQRETRRVRALRLRQESLEDHVSAAKAIETAALICDVMPIKIMLVRPELMCGMVISGTCE